MTLLDGCLRGYAYKVVRFLAGKLVLGLYLDLYEFSSQRLDRYFDHHLGHDLAILPTCCSTAYRRLAPGAIPASGGKPFLLDQVLLSVCFSLLVDKHLRTVLACLFAHDNAIRYSGHFFDAAHSQSYHAKHYHCRDKPESRDFAACLQVTCG